MKNKIVIILVGPKGAGKTYIGQLIEHELEIPFLWVEKLGLENMKTSLLSGEEQIKEFFHLEEEEIDRILQTENIVVFESTGSHDYFYVVLNRLKEKYTVKLIQVKSPLQVCSQRIKTRDVSNQIPVTEELINRINAKASQVQLEWDFCLDNSKTMTKIEIVEQFRNHLKI